MIPNNRGGAWTIGFLLVGIALLAILFLVPPEQGAPSIEEKWGPIGRSAQLGWDGFGAIGEAVVKIGAAAPNVLGLLTLCAVPLALLGAWTILNFRALIRMFSVRNFLER